jgi:hypothetical protein
MKGKSPLPFFPRISGKYLLVLNSFLVIKQQDCDFIKTEYRLLLLLQANHQPVNLCKQIF